MQGMLGPTSDTDSVPAAHGARRLLQRRRNPYVADNKSRALQ